MLLKANFNDALWCAGLLALAVCLQVQVTLFSNPDYQGLRVNAADLLLPFAGIIILGSLLLKRSTMPQFQKPFGYWAPIALSIVMALAILNGFRIQEAWSSWAIVNKGVGWVVLMSYLALGAWITANKGDYIRDSFLRHFIFFLCAIVLLEILFRLFVYYYFISAFTVLDALRSLELLSGLMANRNAFAFLFLSALPPLSPLSP